MNLEYKVAILKIKIKYWFIFKWIDLKHWKRISFIKLQIAFYRLGSKFSMFQVEITDRLGYLFFGREIWEKAKRKHMIKER